MRQKVRSDRRVTVRMTADELGMNSERVWRIITKDLGMRKICAKMVSRLLNEGQKERLVQVCQGILEQLKTEPNLLKRVVTSDQRCSPRGRPWPRGRPRGHILKSLALASKVKSMASRPQVLENWPVLGSRTALFFELLKFRGALEKFFGKRFFVEILREDLFFFFFGEHLRLCPWSFALASSIPVLGLEIVCPRKGCPWPWPRALCHRLHLC